MSPQLFLDILTYSAMSLTVVLSIVVVSARSPIFAALCLITSLLTAAVLFVLLKATFIAAAQVLIYAGGILVLFIYILMLLGVESSLWRRRQKIILVALFLLMFVAGLLPLSLLFGPAADIMSTSVADDFGTIRGFGSLLLQQYAFAFEIISVVLVAVIVGVVYLTRKKSR